MAKLGKELSYDIMKDLEEILGSEKLLDSLHSYFSADQISDALESIDSDWDCGLWIEEDYDEENELTPYLDVILKDDGSSRGGTAYNGETVRDFIEVHDFIDSLELLNDLLIYCGIEKIDKR